MQIYIYIVVIESREIVIIFILSNLDNSKPSFLFSCEDLKSLAYSLGYFTSLGYDSI